MATQYVTKETLASATIYITGTPVNGTVLSLTDHTSPQATATIKLTSDTATDYGDADWPGEVPTQRFTLESTDGTKREYQFVTDSDFGAVAPNIQLSGGSSISDYTAVIKAAIEASDTGHGGKLTATISTSAEGAPENDTVTVAQIVRGAPGNTVIPVNRVSASASLNVIDGDDQTSEQFDESEYIQLIDTAGTIRNYILVDGAESGAPATGTTIAVGASTGIGTLADESPFNVATANNIVVSVSINLHASTATFTCDQNATIGNVLTVIAADGTTKYFKAASSTNLVPNGNTSGTALEFKHGGSSSGAEVIAALRTCMVSANGFGSAGVYFTISAVVGTTITLTQTVRGPSGNTTITSNVDNLSINGGTEATDGAFTGGSPDRASQAAVLNEIRTAILGANGHNGTITCGANLVPADGPQSILLSQAADGAAGNTITTTTIDQITAPDFAGGTPKDWTINGGTVATAFSGSTEQQLAFDTASTVADGTLYGPGSPYVRIGIEDASTNEAIAQKIISAINGSDGGEAGTATIKLMTGDITAYGDNGTISFTLNSPDNKAGSSFTSKYYAIMNNEVQTTGQQGPAPTYPIYIQLFGGTTVDDYANEIKTAIEHDNGHAGKLTVTLSSSTLTNDTITITQVLKTTTGNTAIDPVQGLDTDIITINGDTSTTSFAGGTDKGEIAMTALKISDAYVGITQDDALASGNNVTPTHSQKATSTIVVSGHALPVDSEGSYAPPDGTYIQYDPRYGTPLGSGIQTLASGGTRGDIFILRDAANPPKTEFFLFDDSTPASDSASVTNDGDYYIIGVKGDALRRASATIEFGTNLSADCDELDQESIQLTNSNGVMREYRFERWHPGNDFVDGADNTNQTSGAVRKMKLRNQAFVGQSPTSTTNPWVWFSDEELMPSYASVQLEDFAGNKRIFQFHGDFTTGAAGGTYNSIPIIQVETPEPPASATYAVSLAYQLKTAINVQRAAGNLYIYASFYLNTIYLDQNKYDTVTSAADPNASIGDAGNKPIYYDTARDDQGNSVAAGSFKSACDESAWPDGGGTVLDTFAWGYGDIDDTPGEACASTLYTAIYYDLAHGTVTGNPSVETSSRQQIGVLIDPDGDDSDAKLTLTQGRYWLRLDTADVCSNYIWPVLGSASNRAITCTFGTYLTGGSSTVFSGGHDSDPVAIAQSIVHAINKANTDGNLGITAEVWEDPDTETDTGIKLTQDLGGLRGQNEFPSFECDTAPSECPHVFVNRPLYTDCSPVTTLTVTLPVWGYSNYTTTFINSAIIMGTFRGAGDDTYGAGTIDYPWRSLTKGWAAAAGGTAYNARGDTIIINDNATYNVTQGSPGQNQIDANLKTSRYVTIKAGDLKSPILDGGGIAQHAIKAYADYIIEGLTFRNFGTSDAHHVITQIISHLRATIRDCTFHAITGSAVYFGLDGTVYERNKVYDCTATGLVGGTTVVNNLVYSCGGIGINAYAAASTGSSGNVCQHNTIYDCPSVKTSYNQRQHGLAAYKADYNIVADSSCTVSGLQTGAGGHSYNCVSGTFDHTENNSPVDYTGGPSTGDISADPRFLDKVGGDFALGDGSAVRGAAAGSTVTYDFRKKNRGWGAYATGTLSPTASPPVPDDTTVQIISTDQETIVYTADSLSYAAESFTFSGAGILDSKIKLINTAGTERVYTFADNKATATILVKSGATEPALAGAAAIATILVKSDATEVALAGTQATATILVKSGATEATMAVGTAIATILVKSGATEAVLDPGTGTSFTLTDAADASQVFTFDESITATTGGTIGIDGENATALLSVIDGDDQTSEQFDESEYVQLINTAGTIRNYILVDGAESGAPATGTTMAVLSDTGIGTLADESPFNVATANNIAVNVSINLPPSIATFTCDGDATIGNVLTVIAADGTTKYFKAASSTNLVPNGNTSGAALEFKHSGSSSGAEVIAALRACMVSANGFGSAGVYFTISAPHNHPTWGARTITLTQTVRGPSGNTAITSNVVNLSINGGAYATDGAFTGGSPDRASQAAVLNEIRTAILSENGHNGTITCGASLTPAHGVQSILLTQAASGDAGNTITTTTIDQITAPDFIGADSPPAAIAKRIVDAINDGTITIGITASPTTPVVDDNGDYPITLRQDTAGVAGNKSITATSIADVITYDPAFISGDIGGGFTLTDAANASDVFIFDGSVTTTTNGTIGIDGEDVAAIAKSIVDTINDASVTIGITASPDVPVAVDGDYPITLRQDTEGAAGNKSITATSITDVITYDPTFASGVNGEGFTLTDAADASDVFTFDGVVTTATNGTIGIDGEDVAAIAKSIVDTINDASVTIGITASPDVPVAVNGDYPITLRQDTAGVEGNKSITATSITDVITYDPTFTSGGDDPPYFTLTDAVGASDVFTFDSAVTTTTNGTIGIDGENVAAIAKSIVDTINDGTITIGVTASPATPIADASGNFPITIRQDTAGVAGNKSITVTATALLSVIDGDDQTSEQFDESEYVQLIDAAGTIRNYILVDDAESGAPATGATMAVGSDTGIGTLANIAPFNVATANNIAVNVSINLHASTATFTCDQGATMGNVLTVIAADGTTKYFKAAVSTNLAPNGNTSGTALEFFGAISSGAHVIAAIRACMVSANGFGSAGVYFTISAVVGTTITLTQTVRGPSGNTTITSNVDNLSINGGTEATDGAFTGGSPDRASQAVVLNEIRTAILSENGHNGTITCGASLTPDDGPQSILLTQVVDGAAGNTITTTTIDQITAPDFAGGTSSLTDVITYDIAFTNGRDVVNPAVATGTITFSDAPNNNDIFSLTDFDQNIVNFIFDTGFTPTSYTIGQTKLFDEVWRVRVGLDGANDHETRVTRLRDAINNVTEYDQSPANQGGTNLTLNIIAGTSIVTSNAGRVVLTQNSYGPAGNQTIDMSGVTNVIATDFAGGADGTSGQSHGTVGGVPNVLVDIGGNAVTSWVWDDIYSPADEEYFTLTDAANASVDFIMLAGTSRADGQKGTSGAENGKVIVGLNLPWALSGNALANYYRDQLVGAINHQTDVAVSAFAVSSPTAIGKLIIKQDIAGAAGNKALTTGTIGDAAAAAADPDPAVAAVTSNFLNGGGAGASAISLETAIKSAAGHAGTIGVTSSVAETGAIVMTQGTTGFAGNTDITHPGAYAVAKISFTALPDVDDTIKIISADGTEVTYITKASPTPGTAEFERGSNQFGAASGLKTAIDGFSHAGKITGERQGSQPNPAILFLTQAVAGTTGNTVIDNQLSNSTHTDFYAVPTGDLAIDFNDSVSGYVSDHFSGGHDGESLPFHRFGPSASTATSLRNCINTPASATFTFTAAPADGSTISLTDSDGTNVIFEMDNLVNGVSNSNAAVPNIAITQTGMPNVVGTSRGTAQALVVAINAQSALDITATNPDGAQVALVQGTTGQGGRTPIIIKYPASLTLTVNSAPYAGNAIAFRATNDLAYVSYKAVTDVTPNLDNQEFSRDGTTSEIATSLGAAIEADNGHGGKIAVVITDNVMLLQQHVAGYDGNTGVDNTDNSVGVFTLSAIGFRNGLDSGGWDITTNPDPPSRFTGHAGEITATSGGVSVEMTQTRAGTPGNTTITVVSGDILQYPNPFGTEAGGAVFVFGGGAQGHRVLGVADTPAQNDMGAYEEEAAIMGVNLWPLVGSHSSVEKVDDVNG